MNLTWQVLAGLQTVLLILFVAGPAAFRRVLRGRTRVANAAATLVPTAVDTSPTQIVAPPIAAAVAEPASEVQETWLRLRLGLHAVLESAAPVMTGSSWAELHRLLCVADRLHGVASPELALKGDDPVDALDRWHPLLSALAELRAVAANSTNEQDENQFAPLLAALVAAIDDLRDETPALPPPDSKREQELKQMISQFTRDSRDMLATIRKLENENTALREQ